MASVAILGGYGGMGRLFAKTLKKNGFSVVIAGPTPEKGKKASKELGVPYEPDNGKAVRGADIVIITVPIAKTEAVIKDVAPLMRLGSLLMDLTSVKKGPCEAMAKAAPAGVAILGCHPMFGPMTSSFKGQNFVLCPIRESKWVQKFKDLLKKEGASAVTCTPEEHDKAMGVIQGMTHFMLISAGIAMKDLDFDVRGAKDFASPVYQLVMDLVGRILGQDPRLYGEIQLNNLETKRVREAYLRAAKRLDAIISKGDEEGFVSEMALAARHFGDTEGSMKRVQEIVDKRAKKG